MTGGCIRVCRGYRGVWTTSRSPSFWPWTGCVVSCPGSLWELWAMTTRWTSWSSTSVSTSSLPSCRYTAFPRPRRQCCRFHHRCRCRHNSCRCYRHGLRYYCERACVCACVCDVVQVFTTFRRLFRQQLEAAVTVTQIGKCVRFPV